MSQIFHHSTNTFARITIFGAVFILGFLAWAFSELDRSSYETRASEAREQPVVVPEESARVEAFQPAGRDEAVGLPDPICADHLLPLSIPEKQVQVVAVESIEIEVATGAFADRTIGDLP